VKTNFNKIFLEKVREKIENWEKVGRLQDRDQNEELDRKIEMKELELAISKLRRGKAAGEDGCINEILKNGGEALKISLLTLFQKFWETEQIPTDWARGIIVPIYKDGDRSNPDNYRGITLLSVVGKLYTAIINERLSEWLETTN